MVTLFKSLIEMFRVLFKSFDRLWLDLTCNERKTKWI